MVVAGSEVMAGESAAGEIKWLENLGRMITVGARERLGLENDRGWRTIEAGE